MDAIIAVVSWEPRFMLGLERLLETADVGMVLAFHYSAYDERTQRQRQKVQEMCQARGIPLEVESLSFTDPAHNWRTLYATCEEKLQAKDVLLDITTMPRETMWMLLTLLEAFGGEVRYAYHRPEHYAEDWLSRDPGRPRLVIKHAGLAQPGAETRLLVLTGFDVDRVHQLAEFFEPVRISLGLQVGKQYDNDIKNVEAHRAAFKDDPGARFFRVDAYSNDHGLRAIEHEMKEALSNGNTIMASLGPKLSSVALWQSHRCHAETALVYTPSAEFNIRYSTGITDTVFGSIPLPQCCG